MSSPVVPPLVQNATEVREGAAAELGVELVLAYAGMVALAVVPIWLGAWLAVRRKYSPRLPGADKEEAMTARDAYLFPVIGSAVLCSLYLLFKLLDKDYVNVLLTAYFLLLGFSALVQSFAPLVATFAPALAERRTTLTVPLPLSEPWVLPVSAADAAAVPAAVAVLVWYGASKSWLANNVLGVCFSVQGVSMINLGSYQTGAILLGGLFFYDIWWVFFTEVMVTVAKSFDAPIKLLFPKNFLSGAELEFAMLGLGDIVIPGIFIALLLRFDAHLSKPSAAGQPLPAAFARPFFRNALVAYVLGLVVTITVMHWFQAAQPALLYLVPACLSASLLTALVRGQLSALLAYHDDDDEMAKGDKAKTQ